MKVNTWGGSLGTAGAALLFPAILLVVGGLSHSLGMPRVSELFNNVRSDKGCQNDNLSPRSPTMFFPFSHCSPSKRPPPPVLLEQRKTLFAKVSADHSRYKLPPAFRIAAPPPLWFETRITRWWCLPAEAHDYAASSSGSNSPESVAACSTAIPASTIDLNDRARA